MPLCCVLDPEYKYVIYHIKIEHEASLFKKFLLQESSQILIDLDVPAFASEESAATDVQMLYNQVIQLFYVHFNQC